MNNQKLTNIHIRMNWERLGKYAPRKRRLRLQFNGRRYWRDVVPALKGLLKRGWGGPRE